MLRLVFCEFQSSLKKTSLLVILAVMLVVALLLPTFFTFSSQAFMRYNNSMEERYSSPGQQEQLRTAKRFIANAAFSQGASERSTPAFFSMFLTAGLGMDFLKRKYGGYAAAGYGRTQIYIAKIIPMLFLCMVINVAAPLVNFATYSNIWWGSIELGEFIKMLRVFGCLIPFHFGIASICIMFVFMLKNPVTAVLSSFAFLLLFVPLVEDNLYKLFFAPYAGNKMMNMFSGITTPILGLEHAEDTVRIAGLQAEQVMTPEYGVYIASLYLAVGILCLITGWFFFRRAELK